MKIIILVFQIWIISVYSSDLSYFDDLLNENQNITNNNLEEIRNEDITNNQDIPYEEITNYQDTHKTYPNIPFNHKKVNKLEKTFKTKILSIKGIVPQCSYHFKDLKTHANSYFRSISDFFSFTSLGNN